MENKKKKNRTYKTEQKHPNVKHTKRCSCVFLPWTSPPVKKNLASCVYLSLQGFLGERVWWVAAKQGSKLKHHSVYSTHVTSVSHSASLGRKLWLVLQNKCCWNCEHIAVNTQQDVASWRSALCLRLLEINQKWSIVESKYSRQTW